MGREDLLHRTVLLFLLHWLVLVYKQAISRAALFLPADELPKQYDLLSQEQRVVDQSSRVNMEATVDQATGWEQEKWPVQLPHGCRGQVYAGLNLTKPPVLEFEEEVETR